MLKLLFADETGRVYEHPELLALARGGVPAEAPVPLPPHATLAVLPGRRPLGLDPSSGGIVEVSQVRIGRDRGRPMESKLAELVTITTHPSAILRSQDDAERKAAMEQFVADLTIVSHWLGSRPNGRRQAAPRA